MPAPPNNALLFAFGFDNFVGANSNLELMIFLPLLLGIIGRHHHAQLWPSRSANL
jgi:hypothetical protein